MGKSLFRAACIWGLLGAFGLATPLAWVGKGNPGFKPWNSGKRMCLSGAVQGEVRRFRALLPKPTLSNDEIRDLLAFYYSQATDVGANRRADAPGSRTQI